MTTLLLYVVASSVSCLFNDLTLPSGTVSVGTACVAGQTVANGGTCTHTVAGYACVTTVCVGTTWSVTTPCVGNGCTGGPTVSVTGADYTSCSAMVSGNSCSVGCQTGYRRTSGVIFNLLCTANQYVDGSAVQCNRLCASLADLGTAFEESACNSIIENSQCSVVCSQGYSSPTPALSTVQYSCAVGSAGGQPVAVAAATPTCNAISCSSGPLVAALNADYSTCIAQVTGQVCNVACIAGYEQSVTSLAFTLVCNVGNTFTDSSNIQCSRTQCTGGPTNAQTNADYSLCNVQFTSETCIPRCSTGYTPLGAIAGFTLLCQLPGRTYGDTSGITCTANSCSFGPSNGNAFGDYTACNALQTGGSCLPTCQTGYSDQGGASAFVITCFPSAGYNDLSSLSCVGNTCSNTGPNSNAIANADYSLCQNKRSGESCTIRCLSGYELTPSTIPTTFTMSCDNGGNYDDTRGAAGLQCLPQTCTNGPINQNVNGVYTSCNNLRTGQLCTVACDTGYTKTSGNDFNLVCVGGQYSDNSQIVCTSNACTGGATTPTGNGDYASCMLGRTGSSCTPRCASGYTASYTGNSLLPLVCSSTGQFTDSTGLSCTGNSCSSGAVNPTTGVDYSSCNSQVSGQSCSLTCQNGYTAAGGMAFTLLCNSGQYTDLSSLACNANSCTGGPLTAVANSDYSSCNNQNSGETCTPLCLTGYTATYSVNSLLSLRCDASSRFQDTTGLSCTGSICNVGATNPGSGVDYSSCVSQISGQSCTPTCTPGYTKASGTAFNLICTAGQFQDTSGTTCTANTCQGGPITSKQNVDYSSCLTVRTGELCSPVCTNGYVPTSTAVGAAFIVNCNAGGTFVDASPLTCQGATCTLGPQNTKNGVDYSQCNSLSSGQVCTFTCQQGFTLRDTGTGVTTYELLCVSELYVDTARGTLSCVENTCQGGALVSDPNALDYSACTGLSTGGTCNPTCRSGYARIIPTFLLVCDATGRFPDTASEQCLGLSCSGSAVTPGPFVDYSQCTSQVSGNQCVVSCISGYTPDPAFPGTAFTLACPNGRFTDNSNIQCVPSTCTAVNTVPPPPEVDYTPCVNMVTNQICTPACSSGYTVLQNAIPFLLLCSDVGTFTDSSSLSCVGNSCVGGPRGATNPQIDYSRCNLERTGAACSLTCQVGYAATMPPSDFVLNCDSVGLQYTDGSGLQCQTALCTGGPVTPQTGVDYSDCLNKRTTQSCLLSCQTGFVSAGTVSKQLTCSGTTNQFDGATSLSCVGNICSGGALNPTSNNVDYSSCNNQRSGEVCFPVCRTGFTPVNQMNGNEFPLVCDSTGTYTDSSTARLQCVGQPCINGPTNPNNNLDYSDCNAKNSGDSCTVSCRAGFVATGTGAVTSFGLVCNQNRYTDQSSLVCLATTCLGGPLNPQTNGVYTTCNSRRSGDDCTVLCTTGYTTRTSSVFVLQCDPTTGSYTDPLTTLTCDGRSCQSGPRSGSASANANFTDCLSKRTGDSCTVSCLSGYTRTSGGTIQGLLCNSTGFDDSSSTVCTPAQCRQPTVVEQNINYTPCTSGSVTGDQCSITCVAGYSVSRQNRATFVLACDPTNGNFIDESGTTCIGQTCQLGPVTAVVGADYSSCNPMQTGEMCDPVCIAGYTKTAGVAFSLVCDQNRYPDTSNIQCSPVNCQNPTNPSTNALYSDCSNRRSGESCTVSCVSGYVVASAGLPMLVLQCTPNYVDNTNTVCQPARCTGGPTSSSTKQNVDYSLCSSQQTGSTCQLQCSPGAVQTGSSSLQLVCDGSNQMYDDTSVIDCQIPTGECLRIGSLCTAVGQRCNDPDAAIDNNWSCECVPPQVGAPVVMGTATCLLNECVASSCPTGQTCSDPDQSVSGNWQCACDSPSTGTTTTASPATCIVDECASGSVGLQTCTAAGQTCQETSTATTSLGDWRCICPSPAIGEAQAAVAMCSFQGECVNAAISIVCTSVGQTCVDTDRTTQNNWVCECVSPQVGTPGQQSASSNCAIPTAAVDECVGNPCSSGVGAQTCSDPNQTIPNNYICTCTQQITITNTGPANCTFDECTVAANTVICAQAGQVCSDSDELTSASWECQCGGSSVGVPGAQQPAQQCQATDECGTNNNGAVCTNAQQLCVDPTPTMNDWECRCILTTGSAVMTVAACGNTIDECVSMPCGATQSCNDPNTTTTSTSDFICSCVSPAFGTDSVGSTATCTTPQVLLDECLVKANVLICSNAAQECFDPNPYTVNTSDWMCSCIQGITGQAVGRPAQCRYTGECILNNANCPAGTACVDPNINTIGDWSCVSQPVDECDIPENSLLCTSQNQVCFDPVPNTSGLNDWECQCVLPLTGSSRVSVAVCVQDECQTAMVNQTCGQFNQLCVDTNTAIGSLNDWQCRCAPPSTGTPSTTSAALCVYDECSNATINICTAGGQTCVDPNPDPLFLDDWVCTCPTGSNGNPTTASLAQCNFNCSIATVVGYTVQCGDPLCQSHLLQVSCNFSDGFFGSSPQAVCNSPGGQLQLSGCFDGCQIPCPDPGQNSCLTVGSPGCLNGDCQYSNKLFGTTCGSDQNGQCDSSGVCISTSTCNNGTMCTPPIEECLITICIDDACVDFPRANGTACNDKLNIGFNSVGECQDGQCITVDRCGSQVCTSPGECHDRSFCNIDTGECTHVPFADGVTCDDQNPQTLNDICKSGICVGELQCGSVRCSDRTSSCVQSQCQGGQTCIETPNLAQTCTDGNPQTSGDVCTNSGCVGTDVCSGVTCDRVNQCRENYRCNVFTGSCFSDPIPNYLSCDDGSDLTIRDSCYSGVCNLLCNLNLNPCTNTTYDQCKNVPVCDGSTGSCVEQVVQDGTQCDDQDPDTVNDMCTAGICTGTSRCDGVVCSAVNDCREPGVCQNSTGQCTEIIKPDTTPCDDGDPTTTNDQCNAGSCVGIKTCQNTQCATPTNPCMISSCTTTGNSICTEIPGPDGNACSDNNTLTFNDTCYSGLCVGCPVCDAVSQCHDVGICDQSTGFCSEPVLPDGMQCDDGVPLTQTDTCRSGTCSGIVTCQNRQCPQLQPEALQCNQQDCSGSVCTTSQKPDGTLCSDGIPSTVNDTCMLGVCQGISRQLCSVSFAASSCAATGQLVVNAAATLCEFSGCTEDRCCLPDPCLAISGCVASDQCHQSGTCQLGKCSNPIVPDGINKSCDDGNPDTVSDKCISGVCIGSSKCNGITCTPRSQCLTAGTCNPSTGLCENETQRPDGTTCDDGSITTRNDVCRTGTCQGTNKCTNVVCTAASECHQPGICNPSTGLCTVIVMPDNTACGTTQSPEVRCVAGLCKNGTFPADPCGYPTPYPDGTSCFDNVLTTLNDKCQGGVCIGEDKCKNIICKAPTQCFESGQCDPATGSCSYATKTTGTACNDFDPLTISDKCTRGDCIGISKCSSVTCVPSDQCHTAGVCNPITGVCSDPTVTDQTACDDGDLTTTSDVCVAGTCQGQLSCPSGTTGVLSPCSTATSQCMMSVCLPGNGGCSETQKPDSTSCNDFLPTTTNDQCQSGTCVGVDPCSAITCSVPTPGSLQDQCLDPGICVIQSDGTGLCSDPVAAQSERFCDDNEGTTDGDKCVGNICVGQQKCLRVTCSPQSQCHMAGDCNPSTGICSSLLKRNGSRCDDGFSDTENDVCISGVCRGENSQTSTMVKIELTTQIPRLQVESRRDSLRSALLAVLPDSVGSNNDTIYSLTVSEHPSGGSVITAIVVEQDSAISSQQASSQYANLIQADIDKGDSGAFSQVVIPIASHTTTPLSPLDECASALQICSATQVCLDPTPFSEYAGDYSCSCMPPFQGIAYGKPAVCAASDGSNGRTDPVTVLVAPSSITASPLLIDGYRNKSAIVAWAARVAQVLNVPSSQVTAQFSPGDSAGGYQGVTVSFSGSGSDQVRSSFIVAAACCPSCVVGGSFCTTLGINELKLAAISCESLTTNQLCATRSPTCTWSQSSCSSASSSSDDDSTLLITLLIIVLVCVALLGCCLWVLCCRNNKNDDPGFDDHDLGRDQPDNKNEMEAIKDVSQAGSPTTGYVTMNAGSVLGGLGSVGNPAGIKSFDTYKFSNTNASSRPFQPQFVDADVDELFHGRSSPAPAPVVLQTAPVIDEIPSIARPLPPKPTFNRGAPLPEDLLPTDLDASPGVSFSDPIEIPPPPIPLRSDASVRRESNPFQV